MSPPSKSSSGSSSTRSMFSKKKEGTQTDSSTLHSFDSTSSGKSSISVPKATHIPDMQKRDDMLGEFFGGRAAPAASKPSPSSCTLRSDVESSSPYTTSGEYPTIARYLFIYGFVFPPLWIMGIILLCVPLRPAPGWADSKSEVEQSVLLSRMRSAELKWGKRCLYALLSFLAIVGLTVIIVLLAIRHH